jgi:cyanate permease
LTYTEAGLILAVPGLAGALFAIFGGVIADLKGIRVVGAGAALLMGLAPIFASFSRSFIPLFSMLFLYGIGSIIITVLMPKTLGHWFKSETLGTANGFRNTGFAIGSFVTLGLTMSFFIFVTGTWSGVFQIYGSIAVIGALLWYLFARESQQHSLSSIQSKKREIIQAMRSKNVWFLSGYFFCVVGSYIGMVGWLPHILELKGLSIELSGYITSFIFLTNIVGSLAISRISDKIGKRKPVLIILALTFGPAIYFAGTVIGLALWIAVALMGLCIGGFFSLVTIIPVELREIGPSLSGTAIGLIISIAYTASFIEPFLAGYLKSITGSFMPGIVMFTLLPLLASVFAFMIEETGHRK